MNTNHYASLDLCRKLTEEGFPETEKFMKDTSGEILNKGLPVYTSDFYNRLVCPSIAELLDELPKMHKDFFNMEFYIDEEDYTCGYYDLDTQFSGTLPNALAECWLYLKENDLLPKK